MRFGRHALTQLPPAYLPGRRALQLVLVLASALLATACSCGKEAAQRKATNARGETNLTARSSPTGMAGRKARDAPIPKPPVREGLCDCDPGEYCARGLEPIPGGYPKHIHRCLPVAEDCQRCDCLAVDPCWEPMLCRGLQREREEVMCDNPKVRRPAGSEP